MSAEAGGVCGCCGGDTAHPGWGPRELRVCVRCGSGRLPAQARAYDAAYFDGQGGVDYQASRRQFGLIHQARLAALHRAAPAPGADGRRGRLFELGCALGFFLEDAEACGWEGWGVEISAFAAGRAREHFGDRVHAGTLDDAPADWGPFQAACAFHVLEHLERPGAALDWIAARQEAGGLLEFEVPDFGSRPARQRREHWQYFLPGEHLNYFTQPGLAALLGRHGYAVVSMTPTSFTRLLGGLDRFGMTRLRELLLSQLRRLAWVKRLVLRLRGMRGGHDCVLVVARRAGASA